MTLVEGVWKKPFLALLPRDAAYPSDSCGGEIRRGEEVYDAAYQPWVLPPADDERGFTVIPAATVNACPGWDAESVGGAGNGEFAELVQYLNNEVTNERVYDFPEATVADPLAFVVWSQGARKDTYVVRIDVNLPPLDH